MIPLAATAERRARLAALPLPREFHEAVAAAGCWPLTPAAITTLQINAGKLCNQRCRHCHVDAGPDRREVMTRETMALCVGVLARTDIATVDITGGAPELNPSFRWLVERTKALGVRFDALYCITNMPISRYLEWLAESGNLEQYMQRLVESFNPPTIGGVMCRSMISVGWDGRLYECDFNQMLDLAVEGSAPRHISDFDLTTLGRRRIVVGRHCFGCTAGAGSSCGGSIE